MRKRVKITESQIKRIIAESTRKVLNEEMFDSSFLDNLADKIGNTNKNSALAVLEAFDYAIDAATRCGISSSKFVEVLKYIADEEVINISN